MGKIIGLIPKPEVKEQDKKPAPKPVNKPTKSSK